MNLNIPLSGEENLTKEVNEPEWSRKTGQKSEINRYSTLESSNAPESYLSQSNKIKPDSQNVSWSDE